MLRFLRGVSHPAATQTAVAADPSRWQVLIHDYDMLRQDERSFISVMVAMASVIALVGGTSAFFLLRGCGLGEVSGCTPYPWQAYAILPAPTLAICALLVQQATAATIRGRIMLALEATLATEFRQEFVLGRGRALALSSYHLQQPVIHGARGASLWTLMFVLPFSLVLALIHYSGQQISGEGQWVFYGVYGALVIVIAWAGSPVLRGYGALDGWLSEYLESARRQQRVRI
jgi:hypothetical protein